jgi:hypothetical protein
VVKLSIPALLVLKSMILITMAVKNSKLTLVVLFTGMITLATYTHFGLTDRPKEDGQEENNRQRVRSLMHCYPLYPWDF